MTLARRRAPVKGIRTRDVREGIEGRAGERTYDRRKDTPMANDNGDRPQGETERYRQAAEDALQQLDWCIGYLHGIRKLEISRALARNRGVIRTQLMRRSEQPLPAAEIAVE
jgi:hypothetical protein